MTITISADGPRAIKALEIAAGASQWLKCRTDNGRKAYGVPSQCQPGATTLSRATAAIAPTSSGTG
jgi:hypothetical protein